MFDHPQVTAEGMMATFGHPGVGQYVGFDKPVRFGRTPGSPPFAAPAFGQHADAILARNGYSADEIARLRDLGVIPPLS
jgi:crotonobetainyl-CoA:carnitine CoA-transferase CaiB-like acyl-CoA transferase